MAASALLWAGIGGGSPKEAYALGADTGTMQNTITVTGQGKVKVEPDVAYVRAAVSVTAKTAKEAQAGNAARFAAVKKVLSGTYKVSDKDVKTIGFYVHPQYNYTEKDGQVLTGYTSVHEIEITYRNLSGIGNLLDDLATAGVNQMNGVTFDTEKSDLYGNQALEKAVANARSKAETIAKASGRQLKETVSISENGAVSTPIPGRMYSEAAADSAMSKAATTVEAGEISVEAQLTVVYSMQ
ncbi:hypothetical protein VN24_11170 [Paenibacillus beijingensis]|uniref:Periplasmic immunogenic protein n=2 Tax=Paenibacillus beijingensis TaxID=1126833 RepID=A0A0D5NRQ7_9BACL|nr:hypothetical protein VN24_11170 [Paenibacillus beijingensis]